MSDGSVKEINRLLMDLDAGVPGKKACCEGCAYLDPENKSCHPLNEPFMKCLL